MNRGSCVDCEEQDAYYIDFYGDELCSTCYTYDNNFWTNKKRNKQMKKFKISIIVEVEDQSIEDMEYNAQQYIKDDIEDNALYIEDIEEVEEIEPEEKGMDVEQK